jgi:hypothetical protein
MVAMVSLSSLFMSFQRLGMVKPTLPAFVGCDSAASLRRFPHHYRPSYEGFKGATCMAETNLLNLDWIEQRFGSDTAVFLKQRSRLAGRS